MNPGVILNEMLTSHKMTSTDLAIAIGVPPNRITEIVRGKRSITADTAIRLGRYFSTTPEYWLLLQIGYDLALARQ